MLSLYRALFLIAGVLLFWGKTVTAKVAVEKYNDSLVISRQVVEAKAAKAFDALLVRHPQLSQSKVAMAIEHPRVMVYHTSDFYILIFVCIMLGAIKVSDPRYFQNLWRAFRNPGISTRHLKDQLQAASLSSLLMNLFFIIVSGIYIYFVVRAFIPQRSGNISPSLLMAMLIAGMGIIYLAKYLVIRSSGWAFKVEGITEHYLFNVFLINKIVAICLLPFTLLLAFGDPVYAPSLVLGSFAVLAVLFINRYTRSWQVFGSFFQFSNFHFFMYLCASELLPLAVLMKILVRGVLYY